jgi:hypothetical protein
MTGCELKFVRNDIKLSPMGEAPEAPEASVTREILRQRSTPRFGALFEGVFYFEAQGVDISCSEDETTISLMT